MSEFPGPLAIPANLVAKAFQQRIMDAVADGETPNEHAVIDALTQLVLTQSAVHPDFQELANAVIAKAFLTGKMPAGKAKNRPKGSGRFAVGASRHSAEDVAVEFFDALDTCEDLREPASHDEVVAWLAERHSASEDTIWRALKEAEPWLPEHKAARDQLRREADLMGLPWDHQNKQFAVQVKEEKDKPASISGRSIPDAILLVSDLIGRAVEGIKGKK